MSDEQDTTPNPTPLEPLPTNGVDSILPSEPAVVENHEEVKPEPTTPTLTNLPNSEDSNPSVPVESLGSDGSDLNEVEIDNIPPSEDSEGSNPPPKVDEIRVEMAKEPETLENPHQSDGKVGRQSVPVPDIATGQLGGNDPLKETVQNNEIASKNQTATESSPVVTPSEIVAEEEKPSVLTTPIPVPVVISNKNKMRELLIMAKNAIRFRKRRKLEKLMTLFLKKQKIRNDEVEKLLRISDSTATRYLAQLVEEGKIKQHGKTGQGVFYTKI